ncbi:hypothetical protein WMY93_003276 [Mugilogobius chulae]|uniref:Reverse transcriptase n=1 Tax=Mugilogobius chulae TaxID=88201 RepID=A0AAW0Q4E2_9GOBI
MLEVKQLKLQNEEKDKRIAALEGRIADLEQYSRINDVVITGLDIKPRSYARAAASQGEPTQPDLDSTENQVITFLNSKDREAQYFSRYKGCVRKITDLERTWKTHNAWSCTQPQGGQLAITSADSCCSLASHHMAGITEMTQTPGASGEQCMCHGIEHSVFFHSYKEKVERLFQNGKPKDAWQGVKTLAGLPASSSPSGLPAEVSFRMAEELNNFYCRFDQCDYTQEREELSSELLSIQTTDNLQLQPEDVELILRRTKPSKAPGPDQICGRLLKVCSSQLAGVLCSLFNRSLAEHSIPSIWKSSIICPVAKKATPPPTTTIDL